MTYELKNSKHDPYYKGYPKAIDFCVFQASLPKTKFVYMSPETKITNPINPIVPNSPFQQQKLKNDYLKWFEKNIYFMMLIEI
jgi:hypothetical protein